MKSIKLSDAWFKSSHLPSENSLSIWIVSIGRIYKYTIFLSWTHVRSDWCEHRVEYSLCMSISPKIRFYCLYSDTNGWMHQIQVGQRTFRNHYVQLPIIFPINRLTRSNPSVVHVSFWPNTSRPIDGILFPSSLLPNSLFMTVANITYFKNVAFETSELAKLYDAH